MENVWDTMGAIIAAVITALGGFYMYDRKTTHERLSKVEDELVKNKLDIAVIEVKFTELKADTEEIKSSQRDIIDLLTKRRR